MIPGVKTVSLLAPVIGSLAARLIDRAFFEQKTQIIQVPGIHQCQCCGGSRGESIQVDDVRNNPCTTCSEQSPTFKGSNEHLLHVPIDFSTQIRSISTTGRPGQNEISGAIRRSLSHGDLTLEKSKKSFVVPKDSSVPDASQSKSETHKSSKTVKNTRRLSKLSTSATVSDFRALRLPLDDEFASSSRQVAHRR